MQQLRHFIAKLFTNKLFRYLVSGSSAAVVEYSLFNLLFYIILKNHSAALLTSQITSYLSGLLTAFLLHHFWTFKTPDANHTNSGKKQFIMYSAVSLTNLVLSSFILVILKENLHFYPWLAKIITMGMVVSWNFLILNKIIFKTEANHD